MIAKKKQPHFAKDDDYFWLPSDKCRMPHFLQRNLSNSMQASEDAWMTHYRRVDSLETGFLYKCELIDII